jgi:hypothetical protein
MSCGLFRYVVVGLGSWGEVRGGELGLVKAVMFCYVEMCYAVER